MLVMRTNLLKTLSIALLAAASVWQTSAAPVGVVRRYYYPVLAPDNSTTVGIDGIRTSSVMDLIGFGRFPWYPNETTFPAMMEDPTADDSNTGHEDFGLQLRAVLNPPVSGNYNFFISSD